MIITRKGSVTMIITRKGFTLIELVVVILIVGILTAVGLPQFKAYKKRAKKAEAYQILGVMARSQKIYFDNNKQFIGLDFNPTNNGLTGRRFQSEQGWKDFGYPVAPQSQLHYYYVAIAGKFDSSGAALTSGGGSIDLEAGLGRFFTNTISTELHARDCSVSSISLDSFGINSSPGRSYDWVVLGAKTRLDTFDNTCNFISLTMVADSALGSYSPSLNSGFIELDMTPPSPVGSPITVEQNVATCRAGCLIDYGEQLPECYTDCSNNQGGDDPPDDDPPDDDLNGCEEICGGGEDCLASCDSGCMDSCMSNGRTAEACYPSCNNG